VPDLSPLITACILARNEERRIEDALRSLQGWTDEILVIDNESEDGTVAIARRYTDRVLTARPGQALGVGGWVLGSEQASRTPDARPLAPNAQPPTPSAPSQANFDALRNLAIDHAAGAWIFYLDADERVPPALGPILRQLVQERGDEFEALLIPFKHFFCGQWIQHSGWSPGYTRPQLLKKGRFRYNERLHSGVEVDGRILRFPADNPELAIVHYSYDDLHHYLEKLNRYTDGEAENLLADGASHSWQAQLAHFVVDWQQYYERGRADLDGMHGFVLAFMSAFYRFASRAKLWDLRRQAMGVGGWALGVGSEASGPQGQAEGSPVPPNPQPPAPNAQPPTPIASEDPVPANLREMLEFMAHVAQHGPGQWLAPSTLPPIPASPPDQSKIQNPKSPSLFSGAARSSGRAGLPMRRGSSCSG
jgi:glycosyltransferase involved in cell wall biosynthesis